VLLKISNGIQIQYTKKINKKGVLAAHNLFIDITGQNV